MQNFFTAGFYSANRNRLRQSVETAGPIIIAASGQLQRAGDSTYPFAQDANFYYLTGITSPDVTLVIEADFSYLIVPKLSDYQTIFDGGLTDEEMVHVSGVDAIYNTKDGWLRLKRSLAEHKTAATCLAAPEYLAVYGMFTNPGPRRLLKKLRSTVPGLDLIDIRPLMARLRAVKQVEELLAMQCAIDITNSAFAQVKKGLANFTYEYEIEAAITGYIRATGAIDAWKPIVAAGQHSCMLHSAEANARLRTQDVVVIDIGAEVQHYCADITRTFSLGDKFSDRQQAVYQAVKTVQEYGISLQKPGSFVRENEKLIEQFMGEQLIALGLINKIDRTAIRKYFPHATSHFLGLIPHDAGDYSAPLQPNMVVTVEPGIYIHEEGIGVRIEDDVLITDTGCRVLS